MPKKRRDCAPLPRSSSQSVRVAAAQCPQSRCPTTGLRSPSAHRAIAPRFPTHLGTQVEVAEDGLKQEESEFNPDFIVRLLGKLDWDALRKTAAEVSAPRTEGRGDGA